MAVGQLFLMPQCMIAPEAYFFRLRVRVRTAEREVTMDGCLGAVDFLSKEIRLYNVQFISSAGDIIGCGLSVKPWADILDLSASPIPPSAINDGPGNIVLLNTFLNAHDIVSGQRRYERLAVAALLLHLRPFYPYTAFRLAMQIISSMVRVVRGFGHPRHVQRSVKYRILIPYLPAIFATTDRHPFLNIAECVILFQGHSLRAFALFQTVLI